MLCQSHGAGQPNIVIRSLEWSNQNQSVITLHTSQDGYTTFADLPRHRTLTRAAAPLPHFFTYARRYMELYLIPNDPVNTTLITSDGYLRYWVRTSRPLSSLRTCSSIIQRPSVHDNNEVEILGEVTWGGFGRHSVVHSDLFKGRADAAGGKAVRVKDLPGPLSSSRCFIGNDEEEYVWKFCKSTGFQLLHVRTGSVKAIYEHSPSHVARGTFKGQFKTCLRIHPSCKLDTDILVMTFVIMEKKRRDSLGDQVNVAADKEESVAEASAMEGGGGLM